MNPNYPPPPMANQNMQAALEVTAGSFFSTVAWGGMLLLYKQGVSIDGAMYTLPSGTPTLIPVEPGFHVVEFFMRSPLHNDPRYRIYLRSVNVNVQVGCVQPLIYRLPWSVFGWLFNGMKSTVLKVQPMRPLQGAFVGGYGQSGQAAGPPLTSSQAASPRVVSQQPRAAELQGPQVQNEGQEGRKFCTACGTAIQTGAKFCGGCGQSVAS